LKVEKVAPSWEGGNYAHFRTFNDAKGHFAIEFSLVVSPK
jgi:hypothetical protein